MASYQVRNSMVYSWEGTDSDPRLGVSNLGVVSWSYLRRLKVSMMLTSRSQVSDQIYEHSRHSRESFPASQTADC